MLCGSCTSIYSKITLCLYLELQCSCCVWKSFRASLAFCCLWTWNFLQNNWMQAALKLLCSEGFVDNSWTPCDWLHDSSFHWNRTFKINWLFSSVNARTYARKHSRWLKTARPERSAPQCLPAAEMVCVFDCFRVWGRTFFDDGGRLFDPSVSMLDALAVAANTYGCHSCRDVSCALCMDINPGDYKGRKQVGFAEHVGLEFDRWLPKHVVFRVLFWQMPTAYFWLFTTCLIFQIS